MSVTDRMLAGTRYVAVFGAIAISYYVLAILARYLSIPPGFATAIWPSAGLALAALMIFGYGYWPAVFIGSFLLNAGTLDIAGLQTTIFAKSACMAAAASMQAIAGTWLLTRRGGFSRALEDPRDVVSIFVYGAGLACIIGAVISSMTLYISGSLPEHFVPSSMLTWWIGDLLGVSILAPILLLLAAPSGIVAYSRKIIASFALLAIFSLSTYVFTTAHNYYRQVQTTNFQKTANDIKLNLAYTFETYLDVLAYTEGLFSASDEVTSRDFVSFTNIIMARRPEIGAIMWLPQVLQPERAAFEASHKKPNGETLRIVDHVGGGRYAQAPVREMYFPVTYVVPENYNPAARGIDAYGSQDGSSGRARHETMNKVRQTGQSLISPLITVSSMGGIAGLVAYNPVYRTEDTDLPLARRKLLGMVAAVLPVEAVMKVWLAQLRASQVEFELFDRTVPQERKLIYSSAADQEGSTTSPLVGVRSPLLRREHLSIGGRQWELVFTENHMRQTSAENWILWIVLVGSMSFSAILSAFMLLVSGRTQVVQRLVAQKTQEVAAGRDNLEKANFELKRQYEIVAEKEETFRLAMEHASIGMALVTPEGKFRTVNQALCDIVGYSADELQKLDFQNITHPDDLAADEANVARLLRNEVQTYRMQKRYYHKNGHIIWVLLSVSLIRDGTGKPLYFISQIHDISELKEAEFERQELINRLINSNTDLEKFAYVASHDMQEPLRMMASFSELLTQEHGERLNDEGRQYLKLVTDSARRMQTMVSDLLEYARINHRPDHMENIDAGIELQHVKENLATAIKRSNAVITNDELPVIKGNAIQFASLLQNIIGNALKYQRPGNQPKVHVSAKKVGENWEFVITDNGIGMAQESLQKIFEPFTRLNPWQQYQGTGLGLAICQKIVESQGGRIWAESAPGEGSSFHFTFDQRTNDAWLHDHK